MNLNIYKIRVEQKGRQVEQFRNKTHTLFDEVRELKDKLRQKERKELQIKV